MNGPTQTSTKALVSATVAALAVAVTASGTVQTTQCLLPSIPLNKFGSEFAFDCVGYPAGVIVQTRADIHYVNDPGDDAADLMISIQAPSDGLPIWNLTGAGFGWSGNGAFSADVTTELLNGVIDLGNPPPEFSLFQVTIQMQGGQPLAGRFVLSTFNIDILGKPCPWDLDFDGAVGITDFLALLAAWGTDPGGPPDFNSNGLVEILDFLELLANWGTCP